MKSFSSILERFLQQFSKCAIFSNFVHQTTDFHSMDLFSYMSFNNFLAQTSIGLFTKQNRASDT